MTCIIGLLHKGKAYIGGDSAGVSGMLVDIREDPKVFKIGAAGEFMIGFTSSFRMGQVLMYSFKPPVHFYPQCDTYEYMVKHFVEEIRKCFAATGAPPGLFIVIYKNKIYTIDSDFQVGMPAGPFYAVGCGAREAMASMYTTQKSGLPPETRINLAMEATAYYNMGVCGPFKIIVNEE